MQKIETIDLFHYDSDKSYKGRQYAYDPVVQKSTDKTVFIFDDIQDNTHFKDFIEQEKCEFKMFEFGRKYIGIIGNL